MLQNRSKSVNLPGDKLSPERFVKLLYKLQLHETKAIKLPINPHEGYIAISLTVLDVSNQPFIKVMEIKYLYYLPLLPQLVSGTRGTKMRRGCCQDISTGGDGYVHFSVSASISL